MDIGRRIYFDKQTGNVIVNTGERTGNVVETTLEQDFITYKALKEREPESVGCIEFEYGQYLTDFNTCTGYHVNLEDRSLQFSYPEPVDPDNPPAEPVYQKPLSDQVTELKEQLALMQAAMDDMILNGGGF
jgi:hypothetical protein